jgi:hypothetical protein
MEQVFTTKVEIEIDYSSKAPAGFSFESRSASAVIKYGIIVEMRTWGIKDISFWVPEQEINIVLELVENGDENPESFDCKVFLKECKIEVGTVSLKSGVCPNSLTLNISRYKMIPSSSRYLEFEAEAEGNLVFDQEAG